MLVFVRAFAELRRRRRHVSPLTIDVEVKVLDPALREYGLPHLATERAAAYDLRALGVFGTTGDGGPKLDVRTDLEQGEEVTIQPGDLTFFSVGFAMFIVDPGFQANIVPRSSSAKQRLRLGNTYGLIDADYQGALSVGIENCGTRPLTIARGDRIAQMFFSRKVTAAWHEVTVFSEATGRGTGGYGSTGR